MNSSSEDFYHTQEAVHAFCKIDNLGSSEIEAQEIALRELLASDCLEKAHQLRFGQMLNLHLDRLRKGQTFAEFQNQILPAPQVRMGLLIYTLQVPDYEFIRLIAEANQISVQACTDLIFGNEYTEHCTEDGYIAEMWISFKELQAPENLFSHFNLQKLNLLCISQFPQARLDLSGLKRQFLKELVIQGSDFIQELKLAGSPQKLAVHFLKNLQKIDFRAMDVSDLAEVSVRWCSQDLSLTMSEVQQQYSADLRKIKGKKAILPTTTLELDFYAKQYDWDGGFKFLLWLVKHPLCDWGTALWAYWYANPEFFAEFSHQENLASSQSEVYQLIKTIEKKFAKNFYQTAQIAFDPAYYYQKPHFKMPEKVLSPIPARMYEKVEGVS
ncbi:MAG: DUF4274 domain-containing protein [Microscillaceae bacterium]|jgi:hypothetical protein|nr:DUF4274 domain-containing protein [Microscillaceae bacterium]